MPETASAIGTEALFTTKRKDNWWVGPLVTAAVLLAFVFWATFRAFENDFYEIGNLLSPFYSPLIKNPLVSPAILILWAPAGFRMTCYYYRKAYYRSLLLTPPACDVRGPRKSYRGETFILLFQNLHRLLLYVALIFIFVLSYDAMLAFNVNGQFGVTVGSLVLTLNAILLALYTLSCHCWRHLVGGGSNCFVLPGGETKLRYKLWQKVSGLNAISWRSPTVESKVFSAATVVSWPTMVPVSVQLSFMNQRPAIRPPLISVSFQSFSTTLALLLAPLISHLARSLSQIGVVPCTLSMNPPSVAVYPTRRSANFSLLVGMLTMPLIS